MLLNITNKLIKEIYQNQREKNQRETSCMQFSVHLKK
jgi:hypothetical protein